MPFKSHSQSSSENWGHTYTGENDFPGIENLKFGCLQRIANASEKMAANYDSLIRDRDWYKKRYEEQQKEIQKLSRKISAYKGHIARMKSLKPVPAV